MITVAENDNTIVVVPGANGKVDQAYVDSVSAELEQYDMVVLQHEIPLETVIYTVKMCHEKKSGCAESCAGSFSPGGDRGYGDLPDSNEHEAALIFGAQKDMEGMLRKYPEKLVITQGARGVVTCLRSGELLRVPARKSEVVDTTGAGDTLNGAFCVRICAGDDIRNALGVRQHGCRAFHRKVRRPERDALFRGSRERIRGKIEQYLQGLAADVVEFIPHEDQ